MYGKWSYNTFYYLRWFSNHTFSRFIPIRSHCLKPWWVVKALVSILFLGWLDRLPNLNSSSQNLSVPRDSPKVAFPKDYDTEKLENKFEDSKGRHQLQTFYCKNLIPIYIVISCVNYIVFLFGILYKFCFLQFYSFKFKTSVASSTSSDSKWKP